MSNDNKTLADVQPGGMVRLGDQALSTSEGARRYVADFFAKQLRRHDFGNYILTELAADFACALAQHLSAQPSPGGQDVLFIEELAELRRLVPSVNQKHALDAAIAALAAQPSPAAYHGDVDLKWLSGSIGEIAHRLSTYMPTGLAEWADRARDCRIAAQVLSELSAQPSPGGRGDASHYWPEVDRILVDAYVAGSEGDEFDMIAARTAIHATLSARQLVGEPEIWVSPGQLEELKRRPAGQGSNYLPTRLASEGNFTQPLYAAPPAQAVNLGPVRVLADHAAGRINHANNGLCPDEVEGHDTRDPDCPVCSALIESQAVGNG
ncbi:TPA: hypothetical protein ACOEQX_001202 [Stenotrophomonas maltophilia]